MVVTMVLALQAIAPSVAPSATLDLHVAAPPRCGGNGDEIVVCGSPNEQFRLRPLPEKYGPPSLRAETKIIGDATAGVGAQQEGFSDGQVSKKIMVTIRVPF